MKSITLPVAALALIFASTAIVTAAEPPAPKQCTQIYKQYPLNHCKKKDAACLEQNVKSRQARTDAGCKAEKHYNY